MTSSALSSLRGMVAASLKVSVEDDPALMHLFGIKIIGQAIATAVQQEEIASKEDIALLVKQLVAATVEVFRSLTKEDVAKAKFDDSLFEAIAEIVNETYSKTGVIEAATLFELLPSLKLLQLPWTDEIEPLATKLTSKHIPEVKDTEAVKLAIGFAVARVIPLLSSFFGEFLNEKSQITAAMDCIIQGVGFIVNQSDVERFNQDYILGVFKELCDLYQSTVREYIRRTGCTELKADNVKAIKGDFARNVGLLALSIQYCSPFLMDIVNAGTIDA